MVNKQELRKLAATAGVPVTRIPFGKRRAGGRPRKTGPRHPGGRLIAVAPEPGPDPQSLGFATRLRELCRIAGNHAAGRGLAKDYRLNPDYLPTFLGWLGLISSREMEAGDLIARVYGRFERAHGKRRAVQSPAYMGRTGGAEPPADDPSVEADFRLLQEAMLPYGARARAALEAFWIEGRDVGSQALPSVLQFTAAIARAFTAAQHKRDRRARRQRTRRAWRAAAEPIDLDRVRQDRASTVAMLERRALAAAKAELAPA